MKTYEISEDGQSILCLVCCSRSWSPQDIAHRYCGNCHQYHSAMQHQQEYDAAGRKKRGNLLGRLRAWLGLKM